MKDNTQIAHNKISKEYDFPNRSYSKKKKKTRNNFLASQFFLIFS